MIHLPWKKCHKYRLKERATFLDINIFSEYMRSSNEEMPGRLPSQVPGEISACGLMFGLRRGLVTNGVSMERLVLYVLFPDPLNRHIYICYQPLLGCDNILVFTLPS